MKSPHPTQSPTRKDGDFLSLDNLPASFWIRIRPKGAITCIMHIFGPKISAETFWTEFQFAKLFCVSPPVGNISSFGPSYHVRQRLGRRRWACSCVLGLNLKGCEENSRILIPPNSKILYSSRHHLRAEKEDVLRSEQLFPRWMRTGCWLKRRK